MKAWVVWQSTNPDEKSNAGDVPLAVCATEATARRIARGRYASGQDAPVSETTLTRDGRNWIGPVHVVPPEKGDLEEQAHIDRFRLALKAARDKGLTEEEIAALRSSRDKELTNERTKGGRAVPDRPAN